MCSVWKKEKKVAKEPNKTKSRPISSSHEPKPKSKIESEKPKPQPQQFARWLPHYAVSQWDSFVRWLHTSNAIAWNVEEVINVLQNAQNYFPELMHASYNSQKPDTSQVSVLKPDVSFQPSGLKWFLNEHLSLEQKNRFLECTFPFIVKMVALLPLLFPRSQPIPLLSTLLPPEASTKDPLHGLHQRLIFTPAQIASLLSCSFLNLHSQNTLVVFEKKASADALAVSPTYATWKNARNFPSHVNFGFLFNSLSPDQLSQVAKLECLIHYFDKIQEEVYFELNVNFKALELDAKLRLGVVTPTPHIADWGWRAYVHPYAKPPSPVSEISTSALGQDSVLGISVSAYSPHSSLKSQHETVNSHALVQSDEEKEIAKVNIAPSSHIDKSPDSITTPSSFFSIKMDPKVKDHPDSSRETDLLCSLEVSVTAPSPVAVTGAAAATDGSVTTDAAATAPVRLVSIVRYAVNPQAVIAHLESSDVDGKSPSDNHALSKFSLMKKAQTLSTSDVKDLALEDAENAFHVDFANRMIGGGVLGHGSVQEEIRFVINPECIVSLLFCQAMESHEVIAISGTRRYSNYSGYGKTFRFGGHFDSIKKPETAQRVLIEPTVSTYENGSPLLNTERKHAPAKSSHDTEEGEAKRWQTLQFPRDKGRVYTMVPSVIVAMDAFDFRRTLSANQRDRKYLVRELVKAFAGFSIPATVLGFQEADPFSGNIHTKSESKNSCLFPSIATGNWGCGIFGGDIRLKVLLQWIAASLAGRKLLYFPYGDKQIENSSWLFHSSVAARSPSWLWRHLLSTSPLACQENTI